MSLFGGKNDTWVWVIILFVILICTYNDNESNGCCPRESECNCIPDCQCETRRECNCCLR